MRECSEYEITIKQFNGFVHSYTKRDRKLDVKDLID